MATNTPDLGAILAKVQKMLNVEGRTPEEAALFVERAHAILAQYDLSIEDVGQLKADPRTAVAKATGLATSTEGKTDGWKSDLLFAVAEAFECQVLEAWDWESTKSGRLRRVRHYHLVGFGHDLEAARYAHSFLVGEVTRLAKAHVRPMWDEIKRRAAADGVPVHTAERWYVLDEGRHPLKAELYFTRGATETVSESLREEARRRRQQAVDANPYALVVVKSAEVDDFIGRERYGDRWEDVKRRRRAERAAGGIGDLSAWYEARRRELERAEREEQEKLAGMTPAQRERYEARKAKEAEAEAARERRESERYEARWDREQAKIDHGALEAGRRAGRTISIRPGVGSGDSENGGYLD